MFGVNNLENIPNETPHEDARDDSEANNEVFFNNPESTVKKRKMDKSRVKCPRLSSFNMSSLRLSSSNSLTSKVGEESSFSITDEELEELRCSPMLQSQSPIFLRKKLGSYNLTPHKPLKKKSRSDECCSLDIDGVNDPLILMDSINDSNNESIPSPKELLGSVNSFMQEEDQMKTEKVGTPHGLICPPANCPQRPSKVRRSDASYGCNNGGERSCRLLFTKSEDPTKDAVTSYGCDAEFCISQTSEIPPFTPSELGTELNKGALSFASSVQASGSKILDPETPAEINEDIATEYVGIEKSTIQNEIKDNETLKPNMQAFDFNIVKTITSADSEIEPITPLKEDSVIPDTYAVSEIETIIPANKENDLNRFLDQQKGSHTPSMPEKNKVLSENQNLDNVDKSDKFSSPKPTNALNYEISKNYNKNVIGLSTPILRVDVDYSQSLATPTQDENPSKSNILVSNPFVAPAMSSDKYLSAVALSEVKVLLTPTDSPINTPGSGSSCSCSCTECDFSPSSGAKAKMMSQTIESINDMDSEIQMPHVIDVVMDPMIVEDNPSQIHEGNIMDPIIVENNVSQIQENVVESSNKSFVKISERNESLTSTPKDLTPYSVKSNLTAMSGISPLPSSAPRPKHKHKHHHHHHHSHHHHNKQQQSMMHHLTVHSNSHHHLTSDGDILITSTPLNRQNSVEELVMEEISAVGSDIDSANSDFYGKPSRFVMSDLCGSDQSVNQFSLINNISRNTPKNTGSDNILNGGGANYVPGIIGSESFEVMNNKESANNSVDNYKLHLGTDASADGWMIDESVLLPRRASSVDETLFRVFSQESPVCLSLN